MQRRRWIGGWISRFSREALALAISGACLAVAGHAAAQYGVETEAVDWYCGSNNYLGCDAEAAGFYSGLTSPSGTIWAKGYQYQDSQVYDSDFCDPDFTKNACDDDTQNFDYNGSLAPVATGMSWLCSHGHCDDFAGRTTACTASNQCYTPPAGSVGPGYCVGSGPPNDNTGKCLYNKDRVIEVDDCNPNNCHGGVIDYSGGALVKWGESWNSGDWAGAAENGGTNFVAMTQSCAMREEYMWPQVNSLFAGMTLLGLVMPITDGSDSCAQTDRGTYTAQGYTINANSSVGQSFLEAQNSMAYDDGSSSPCPYGASNWTYGGGHGLNGCGGVAAIAIDDTQSEAEFEETQKSWVEFSSYYGDAVGHNFYYWQYLCNYDCSTYRINL